MARLTQPAYYLSSGLSLMMACTLLTVLCLLVTLCQKYLRPFLLSPLCLQLYYNSGNKSKLIPGTLALDSCVPTSDVSPDLIEPSNPTLPVEVIERIADFLLEIRLPIPDRSGNAPINCFKPAWSEVKGFMQASLDLHNMGFSRWLRVVTVKDDKDWIIIFQNMRLVREIRCLDQTLLDVSNQQLLYRLSYLHTATIDAHSDVWHNNDNRFIYRDIITALPPSLKRLEITNAHGPDIRIIATVKKHCPNLEELRLGRCTMFNCIPACEFWTSFPHDHDAYISNTGTDAYAHALGQELSSLKNLHTLRMGLYLVPSDIVLAHRLYHRRGRTAPGIINWQTAIPFSELSFDPFMEGQEHIDPATTDQLISVLHQPDSEPGEVFECPQCVDATAEVCRMAEMSANSILRSHVSSLTKVQWMGWLTPGHLGVHSFELPSSGK